MIIQVTLAFLMVAPVQGQDPTVPKQIKDAFSKVAAGASKLKKELSTVGFHPGICLFGGELRQGGSIYYSIKVNDPSDYGVIVGVSGKESNIEVSVKDANGKDVVTGADASGADFSTSQGGTYTISAKNNGGQTFVALGIVRNEGGSDHPFSSINTAAASYAASIEDAYKYAWGIPTGDLMVVGNLLGAGGSYSRNSKINYPKWLILAVADAGTKSFSLSVTDKTANKTVDGVVEKLYSYSEFDAATQHASIVVKNTSQKTILSLSGHLRQ